ncbi:uncharacterized protein LOC105200833 isoform X2 [Solenopsis invicta]|uniref:uncharacterized protein LOC105200833 isoform X2 n=1 Tax=Solenopsis invicta TaxID=13686 RepID=UPI000E33EA51|nr:uncharacterized protein LOC105200833 isoform X2 [Solenopsis invicta]
MTTMSSFRSNINMDEHEKNLMTGTLEQRKEAFKEDEELMRETTKFISEVIETAATEASKRKIQSEGAVTGEAITKEKKVDINKTVNILHSGEIIKEKVGKKYARRGI